MTDKEKELQAEAIGYYRKRIAELEMTVGTLRNFSNEQATCIERLEKENAELKKDKKELCHSISEGGKACVYLNEQLTNAKGIIIKLKALYLSPVVTKDDVKQQDEILNEAEQFLKDSEV